MKATIAIKGMTCGGCASSVESAVKQVLGIISAQVSLEKAELDVEFDANKVTLADIRETVEKAGFQTE